MRNTILISLLIGGSLVFMSTISSPDTYPSIFTFINQGDPVLPETAFNYENQKVPDHLLETTVTAKVFSPGSNGPWGTSGGGIIAVTRTAENFNSETLINTIDDAGATLGRVLFYDEVLSANENMACATCHKQELSFADDTPFSLGVNEDTKRNSMHLNDLGWSNNSAFFWDLGQGNLKKMIAIPLANENEIGLTDINELVAKMEKRSYYPSLFEAAFGSTEITQEKIQDALAQFISSMTTYNSRFDKSGGIGLGLTQREKQGLFLFKENCEGCHSDGISPFIEDHRHPESIRENIFLFRNGLPIDEADLGVGEWINDFRFRGLFKVPTLRNIELTAPYMHDGRFATLEKVIDHYNELDLDADQGIHFVPNGGFQFEDFEKEALVAFLKTLTDRSFTTDERWSDPFGIISSTYPIAPMEEVQVYPNPSNGLTYVSFDNSSGQKIEAYLMTIDGKVIRKMSTHKNGLMTDVSLLKPGVYVVRLKNGDQFVDQKLVVQ